MKTKKIPFENPKSTFDKKMLDKGVMINTKISLSKIFELDENEKDDEIISDAYKNIVIDILVSDVKDKNPLFAIYYDDPIAVFRKEPFKVNYFFKNTNVGLLKIGSEILDEYEKVSLLEWIIDRNLKWIQNKSENIDSIDPFSDEVIFNAENYFPPLNILYESLTKNNIDTSWITGGIYIKDAKYHCELSKSSEPSNEYGKRINTSRISLVNKDSSEVCSTEAKVLVSVFDIAGVQAIDNIPVFETIFYKTDGITIDEVSESLSIYIALKKLIDLIPSVTG